MMLGPVPKLLEMMTDLVPTSCTLEKVLLNTDCGILVDAKACL